MTFKEQFLNSPPYHISCYRSLQIGHESAGGGNGINEIKMKSAKSLLSSNKTKQNKIVQMNVAGKISKKLFRSFGRKRQLKCNTKVKVERK